MKTNSNKKSCSCKSYEDVIYTEVSLLKKCECDCGCEGKKEKCECVSCECK
jgi:hypothetical protein